MKDFGYRAMRTTRTVDVLGLLRRVVNVDFDGCPRLLAPLDVPCRAPPVPRQVYHGQNLFAYDSPLLPFTGRLLNLGQFLLKLI